MKHKKFIMQIIALLSISMIQPSFAGSTHQESNSQTIAASNEQYEDQDQDENSAETHNVIQQIVGHLIEQAGTIPACLEQVEQILQTNKVKFNGLQKSKEEIFAHIEKMKEVINGIYNSIQESSDINTFIIEYLRWSKCFADYLLPIFKQNVSLINMNTFAEFINKNLNDKESAWNQKFMSMMQKNIKENDNDEVKMQKNTINMITIMYNNDIILEKLDEASTNVGLTTFNKAFRYFQEKKMYLTGKSLMDTAGNIATYGTIALLAYSAILYATPKDCDITVPYAGLKFNTNELWFKNFIGSQKDTQLALNSGHSESISDAFKNFGVLNHVDRSIQVIAGPLLAPMTAIIAAYGRPTYNYIKNASSEIWDRNISYLRGEVYTKSNSAHNKTVYFKDMVDCDHLKEIADNLAAFIKNPLKYENSGTTPPTTYLLTGPTQTGKSLFANALQTLINQDAGSDQKTKFLYVTHDLVEALGGFNSIFAHARHHAPFILFIDEIDTILIKDSKMMSELMTNMSGLNSNSKVIVLAATNCPEVLDTAVLARFVEQIHFKNPTYQQRKKYLTKIAGKKLDSDDIDAIAQETEGCIFKTLDAIVATALRQAKQEYRQANRIDFENALDYVFRKIRPNVIISEQEKDIVATYHAGQAIARELLKTVQKVVKVTIHSVDKEIKAKERYSQEIKNLSAAHENSNHVHDERIMPNKLGHVFTINAINNNQMLSNTHKENELLALLAGQAALELIKGQTFDDFGQEDRAQILHILEKQISQSNPVTDAIRQQAIAQKDILYKKIKNMLAEDTAYITFIAKTLIKYNTIDKQLWAKLMSALEL